MMGEGRVFTTPEEDFTINPIAIPAHWVRLCGIDFGIEHYQAAVWIAWDRDADILYVYDCYRRKNQYSAYHAEAIKSRGHWIPVAWPHDGMNREKGGTGTLARKYMDLGVNMMGKSARYPKKPGETTERSGSQPTEPIVIEVQDRLLSGRFKVFSTCEPFFQEYRGYHRKDGKLVDKNDDVLKAAFYAVMMKRYATRQMSRPARSSQVAVRAGI